jgi:nitric oxide reductase large subunit
MKLYIQAFIMNLIITITYTSLLWYDYIFKIGKRYYQAIGFQQFFSELLHLIITVIVVMVFSEKRELTKKKIILLIIASVLPIILIHKLLFYLESLGKLP